MNDETERGVATAAGNAIRVACLGFVFDALAQRIVAAHAPPGFAVSFAEQPDDSAGAMVAASDFVFCVSPITEAMMAAAPRLRLIHKWGTGVDKIDLAAAERHGIYVAITAGSNASVVAEHTMMLMLAALRRVVIADRSMRAGQWAPAELRPGSRQLAGKTVGILGFGNIGRAVARRLSGFEARVVYHDPKGPASGPEAALASFVTFDELLGGSDILTLHCPGGEANRHLLNQASLARMKRGAVLINAARGELIDEAALCEALASGQLLSAGLDTFETEPLCARSPLRQLDNVVLTPHAAGAVLDHVDEMAAHAFANMVGLLHGRPIPPSDLVVDPARPRFPVTVP